MRPGAGLEGWLRCFAHSFGGVECRWHARYPAFAADPLLLLLLFFRSGSWAFWSLRIFSRICPNCACTQLFSVPYRFFVFCCMRRCLSRCKHCSTAAEGRTSQPVSMLWELELLFLAQACVLSLAVASGPMLLQSPLDKCPNDSAADTNFENQWVGAWALAGILESTNPILEEAMPEL